LVRFPLRNATFERDGARYALAWTDARGRLVPVDAAAAGAATLVASTACRSGDVAYARGHFHPNKAPGTSFLAVPAYALLRGVEWVAGLDADRRGCSRSMPGCVGPEHRPGERARRGARPASGARPGTRAGGRTYALVFAFGTMTWPHATLLLEHNLVGVALLAASPASSARVRRTRRNPRFAGRSAPGMRGPLRRLRRDLQLRDGRARARALGVRLVRSGGESPGGGSPSAPPDRCSYSADTTSAASARHSQPTTLIKADVHHRASPARVFAAPRVDVMLTLLFSPFRGLFMTSPVLLFGVAGLVQLFRNHDTRPWGG